MNSINHIVVININSRLGINENIILRVPISNIKEYYCLVGDLELNLEMIFNLIEAIEDNDVYEYVVLFNDRPINLIEFLSTLEIKSKVDSFLLSPASIRNGVFTNTIKINFKEEVRDYRALYLNRGYIDMKKSSLKYDKLDFLSSIPLIYKDLDCFAENNKNIKIENQGDTMFFKMNKILSRSENISHDCITRFLEEALITRQYEDIYHNINYKEHLASDVFINYEMLRLNPFWNDFQK